jgi:hypothetical protein
MAQFVRRPRKQFDVPRQMANALTLSGNSMHSSAYVEAINNLYFCRRQYTSVAADLILGMLLGLIKSTECSNSRDKVYCILGMVDEGTATLKPDYNKTVEDIYIEAIRLFIEQSRYLTVLNGVVDMSLRQFPDCPTWIGEFKTNTSQHEIAYASIFSVPTCLSRCGPVDLNPAIDTQVLKVRGVLIDRIAELAQPWEWHSSDMHFDPLWISHDSQASGRILNRPDKR